MFFRVQIRQRAVGVPFRNWHNRDQTTVEFQSSSGQIKHGTLAPAIITMRTPWDWNVPSCGTVEHHIKGRPAGPAFNLSFCEWQRFQERAQQQHLAAAQPRVHAHDHMPFHFSTIFLPSASAWFYPHDAIEPNTRPTETRIACTLKCATTSDWDFWQHVARFTFTSKFSHFSSVFLFSVLAVCDDACNVDVDMRGYRRMLENIFCVDIDACWKVSFPVLNFAACWISFCVLHAFEQNATRRDHSQITQNSFRFKQAFQPPLTSPSSSAISWAVKIKR